MASYRALTGLDYNDKRVEAGEVASDIPTKSISWLLEQGLIEPVEESAPKSKKSAKTDESTEEDVA